MRRDRFLFIANYFFVAVLILSGCQAFQTQEAPGRTELKTLKKEVKDSINAGPSDTDSLRKRLLVLPFLDISPDRPKELRETARLELMGSLHRSGEVVILDGDDIKLDDKKLLRTGEYDMKAAAKEAGTLGASAILEGKILEFKTRGFSEPVGIIKQVRGRFEIQARVRVYAAGGGRELYNSTKTISIEKSDIRIGDRADVDRFLRSNPEVIRQLTAETFVEFVPAILGSLSKMNWEGRIAMVNGDRIFLNVGKISGLQIGEVLKVSEDGEEVYDPQSGNYIGRVAGRLKGTLEVVSYFGKDGAIAIVHSGAGFKENDRVEPYNR